MTFKNDLLNAHIVENEVIQMFITSGYTATSTASLGKFSGYDVDVNGWGTIEVKNDILASKTDNVAIEIYKVLDDVKYKSGLSSTTADFQVYKAKEIFYVIPTVELKTWLKELKANNTLPIKRGGDNSSVALALVPYAWFRKKCEKL